MNNFIEIYKANEHNLNSVDLKIPKGELTVFTGVSGSGKSSLAFDTIFAEGQRRYVESLSAYARQFLGQMDKPDVERIDGLSPAVSIDQKSTSNNPRSTVGTITEIYDYLRLLYARVGTPHCPKCGRVIVPQTIDEMVDRILSLEEGTKIQILSPIVRAKKGEYKQMLSALLSEGFMRVRIDGKIYNLEEDEIELNKTQKHTIEIVVDRIIVKESAKSRIFDSAQTALLRADGLMIVNKLDDNSDIIFSQNLACPNCNISFEELTPRLMSFNNPYGACPVCHGIGAHFEISPDLVVPDSEKSLAQGAIYPWAKTANPYYSDILKSVCEHYKIDFEAPFKSLSPAQKGIILYGNGDEKIKLTYADFGTKHYRTHVMSYQGVIPYLTKKYESDSDLIRAEIEKYMITNPCKACGGGRLNPFALSVKINNLNIFEFCSKSVLKEYEFIQELYLTLDEFKLKIARQVLDEIRARLKFLIDVGFCTLNVIARIKK